MLCHAVRGIQTSQHKAPLFYQAWSLGAKELQIQTWGTSAEKMYGVGLDLAGIDNRVVVKLPITDAGIEAAALLKKQGVLVTMTGQHMHRLSAT